MFKYSENCMALVLILYKRQKTDTQHNNNKKSFVQFKKYLGYKI